MLIWIGIICSDRRPFVPAYLFIIEITNTSEGG